MKDTAEDDREGKHRGARHRPHRPDQEVAHRLVQIAQRGDREEPSEEREHFGNEAAQPAEHQPGADEEDNDDIESGQTHEVRG